MLKYIYYIITILVAVLITTITYAAHVPKPDPKVYQAALDSYTEYTNKHNLKKSKIITIVDYSIPKHKPRLWVLDINTGEIIIHTYVAHGVKSGKGSIPYRFSNIPGSHMSSLGLMITAKKPYYGKYGKSLRLIGTDKDLNSNVLRRAIVIHGSNYVSQRYVGHSRGCLSVPMHLGPALSELLRGSTPVYIHGET